jgi:hypothetical protein
MSEARRQFEFMDLDDFEELLLESRSTRNGS